MTDRRNATRGWSLGGLVGRWVLIAVVDFGLWTVTPGIVVSPWRPQAMAAGITAAGPVVGTVTIAHLLLTLVGWYLLAVATLMLVFAVGARVLPERLPSPARVARAISLPGTHRLVAWSLGAATLTVPVLAASPTYAGGAGSGRTAAPVMTEIGPASAPSAGPPTMFVYPKGSTGAPGVAPFPLTTSPANPSPFDTSTLPGSVTGVEPAALSGTALGSAIGIEPPDAISRRTRAHSGSRRRRTRAHSGSRRRRTRAYAPSEPAGIYPPTSRCRCERSRARP